MQSATSKATIKELVIANKTIEEAKENGSHGVYFEAKALDWNQAVFTPVSDAASSAEGLGSRKA